MHSVVAFALNWNRPRTRPQARLKIQSDSIRVVAGRTEIKVADQIQYAGGEQQFNEGLVSKVELEKPQVAQQRANATLIDAQNKLLEARNELLNAELEVNGSIGNDYRDKLSKAESGEIREHEPVLHHRRRGKQDASGPRELYSARW